MLAPRLLQRQLNPYPKDDIRYVPTIEESIERSQRRRRYDQVAQLYRDYLGSQAGELTIVGDFDANACLPILKDTLARLECGQALRAHRLADHERTCPARSTRSTRPTKPTRPTLPG